VEPYFIKFDGIWEVKGADDLQAASPKASFDVGMV